MCGQFSSDMPRPLALKVMGGGRIATYLSSGSRLRLIKTQGKGAALFRKLLLPPLWTYHKSFCPPTTRVQGFKKPDLLGISRSHMDGPSQSRDFYPSFKGGLPSQRNPPHLFGHTLITFRNVKSCQGNLLLSPHPFSTQPPHTYDMWRVRGGTV